MSDLETLLKRAERLAPVGDLGTWTVMLEHAFTTTLNFYTPSTMKLFCGKKGLDYDNMLRAVVLTKDGVSVSVTTLTELGLVVEAYRLAYLCCASVNGTPVDAVFPQVDEWGLETT